MKGEGKRADTQMTNNSANNHNNSKKKKKNIDHHPRIHIACGALAGKKRECVKGDSTCFTPKQTHCIASCVAVFMFSQLLCNLSLFFPPVSAASSRNTNIRIPNLESYSLRLVYTVCILFLAFLIPNHLCVCVESK
jgi:hypothetical protein